MSLVSLSTQWSVYCEMLISMDDRAVCCSHHGTSNAACTSAGHSCVIWAFSSLVVSSRLLCTRAALPKVRRTGQTRSIFDGIRTGCRDAEDLVITLDGALSDRAHCRMGGSEIIILRLRGCDRGHPVVNTP